MKINAKTILDRLIWLATAFLLFGMAIFVNQSWGRYILLASSLVVLGLTILRTKGVVRFRFSAWHGFLLAVIAYSVCSSLWALNPGDGIGKGISFALLLICFSMVYLPFQEDNAVDKMISIVKWAYFAVTIYAFGYYGYDEIVNMMDEEVRLQSSFINVNVLGMQAAIAVVIQVYELTRKRKFDFSVLFCIPSVVMVAATQSRKALLLAIVGIVLVIITNYMGKRQTVEQLLKGAFSVVAVFAVIYFALQLPIFSGVNKRMETFSTLFTGEGSGFSSNLRNEMIQLGWEHFLKNPVVGVGIGSPHVLAARYLGYDVYLHNNFIELLCGGGLIGFFLFYGMYIYLFYNMFKYRKFKDEWYWLCLIMMVLLLIMDYAMVSAYEKNTWFYFMIFFLEVRNLKQRSCAHAAEQIVESGKTVSNE